METNEYRQAYLVMAHKDDLTFHTLIHMLDKPFNDIFIHMDKKNNTYKPESIEEEIVTSKIYHTKRIKVVWGGYSQINAELLLLQTALEKGNYAYYHLVSGEDLPIQNQEYIKDFFEKNYGKEFVRFQSEKFLFEERVKVYHLLQDKIGKNRKIFLRILEKIFINIQLVFGVNRNKKINFQKGTNWFSITNNLAKYIISQKHWIRKTFHHTLCCDEIFLQTLIINSEFIEHLYHNLFDNDTQAIMRLIDWNRGQPYVFRKKDFQEIKESSMLFARKFDSSVDREIIMTIEKEYG